MEKLDKVIAGLEACWHKCSCGDCPYKERGWDCEEHLIDDAMEMLKRMDDIVKDMWDRTNENHRLVRELKALRAERNAAIRELTRVEDELADRHKAMEAQGDVILELNCDLKRCREALNAQGEYAYLGGDLISREALIERIELIDWYDENGKSGAANEESAYVRYADVAEAVKKAPAIRAPFIVGCTYENGELVSMMTEDGGRYDRVVHAHWIENEDELGLCDECSACHIETCGKSPRCPVCGAHMDEEVAG